MKVPHVIAEIVSEFSGFNHTPDFTASRSTGNFEDDDEGTSSAGHGSSSDAHHHEHHGHSLYFGKHVKKLAENTDPDVGTSSNHSGGSGLKHELTAHFEKLFHIGHHSNHKSASGASTPARKNSSSSQTAAHKHSVNITVGANEVPTICATPPNEPRHAHFAKNPNVSPNISRVASYSSLKEKLNKLQRTTSSDNETDFPQKKGSVSSYRVVSH
uniref:Uncharacterized protein n=1 Tax=Caenorhabditis japonica TaxID=281687 RepID=A0A8R1DK12_CAEJA